MRYIRYAFLACLGLVLISVAMANRTGVQLALLPDELAALVGINQKIELPLFVVIFASIVTGLLLGFVWEWLREHKHRAEVVRKQGEVKKLKREVSRLKGGNTAQKDDVLALLD